MVCLSKILFCVDLRHCSRLFLQDGDDTFDFTTHLNSSAFQTLIEKSPRKMALITVSIVAPESCTSGGATGAMASKRSTVSVVPAATE